MQISELTLDLLTTTFSPRQHMSTADWCVNNVILSKRITQSPGPYRIDFVPYVRAIYDAYDDSDVKSIILCWSARSSKTETMFNILRHNIAVDQEPFIYACPSGNLARDWSETRIRPSIEDCEATAAEIPDNDDLFKLTAMHFKHCSGWIIGAGSAANLAGRSCRLLLCDEVDKWPEASSKETGAIQNLTERNRERWNRKTIISSTPTTENGQIWTEFKMTDQRYYFVPCPHCNEFQTLKKQQLKHSNEARDKDGNWDINIVAKTTYYECEYCLKSINHTDKQGMLSKGEWRATGVTKEPGKIGFHLNVLYSPWTSWSEVQTQFIKSNNEGPQELQKFINSWLAEPFFSTGNPEDFLKLIGKTSNTEHIDGVPLEHVAIMTVDVQQTSLFWEICAFDRNRHCTVIDYGQVPDFPELDDVITKWKPFGVFIDSAYAARQSEVFNWSYNKRGCGILAVPVLGSAGLLTNYRWQKVPIEGGMFTGKIIETLRFRPDDYKDIWFSCVTNMGLTEDKKDKGIPMWISPMNATEEWKRHHASEKREVKKLGKSKTVTNWVHKHSRWPNHYFDCSVYAIMGFEAVRSIAFDIPNVDNKPNSPAPMAQPINQVSKEIQEINYDREFNHRDSNNPWG